MRRHFGYLTCAVAISFISISRIHGADSAAQLFSDCIYEQGLKGSTERSVTNGIRTEISHCPGVTSSSLRVLSPNLITNFRNISMKTDETRVAHQLLFIDSKETLARKKQEYTLRLQTKVKNLNRLYDASLKLTVEGAQARSKSLKNWINEISRPSLNEGLKSIAQQLDERMKSINAYCAKTSQAKDLPNEVKNALADLIISEFYAQPVMMQLASSPRFLKEVTYGTPDKKTAIENCVNGAGFMHNPAVEQATMLGSQGVIDRGTKDFLKNRPFVRYGDLSAAIEESQNSLAKDLKEFTSERNTLTRNPEPIRTDDQALLEQIQAREKKLGKIIESYPVVIGQILNKNVAAASPLHKEISSSELAEALCGSLKRSIADENKRQLTRSIIVAAGLLSLPATLLLGGGGGVLILSLAFGGLQTIDGYAGLNQATQLEYRTRSALILKLLDPGVGLNRLDEATAQKNTERFGLFLGALGIAGDVGQLATQGLKSGLVRGLVLGAQAAKIASKSGKPADAALVAELVDLGKKAESTIQRSISQDEMQALYQAHVVGRTEGRTKATYTAKNLREKTKILRAAGFSDEEASSLLRNGVAGDDPLYVEVVVDHQGLKRIRVETPTGATRVLTAPLIESSGSEALQKFNQAPASLKAVRIVPENPVIYHGMANDKSAPVVVDHGFYMSVSTQYANRHPFESTKAIAGTGLYTSASKTEAIGVGSLTDTGNNLFFPLVLRKEAIIIDGTSQAGNETARAAMAEAKLTDQDPHLILRDKYGVQAIKKGDTYLILDASAFEEIPKQNSLTSYFESAQRNILEPLAKKLKIVRHQPQGKPADGLAYATELANLARLQGSLKKFTGDLISQPFRTLDKDKYLSIILKEQIGTDVNLARDFMASITRQGALSDILKSTPGTDLIRTIQESPAYGRLIMALRETKGLTTHETQEALKVFSLSAPELKKKRDTAKAWMDEIKRAIATRANIPCCKTVDEYRIELQQLPNEISALEQLMTQSR